MSLLEPLFNKVTGLKTCNLVKKRLQYRCLPVNIAKFLRTPTYFEKHLQTATFVWPATRPSEYSSLSVYYCSDESFLNIPDPFTINVHIIKKPVNWFALKINSLISIWPLVSNGLSAVAEILCSKIVIVGIMHVLFHNGSLNTL